MRLKLSHKPLSIFGLCIGIVVVLSSLHFVGILSPVENVIAKILSYPQTILSRAGIAVSNSFKLFVSIKDLSSRNKLLEDEVAKLSAKEARLKEIERENEILRNQLGFMKKTDLNLLPAYVLTYDSNNLFQSVTINRGKRQGVKRGMAVVANNNLIGQVVEVNQDVSQVLLIIDNHSAVNALVQDSRADGIVRGEHGLGLIMEMIPQDKVIKKGDLVITSNLNKDIPKDLVIGKVEEVISQENELFQKARVMSFVNFQELDAVYVVKDFNPNNF